MNALVKTIPVTSRGALKCKGMYFLTGWHYDNVMFGSKFLAIVTRFRDFCTLEKNRSEKKISRFQNTKYDFKAKISLFASKIISHVWFHGHHSYFRKDFQMLIAVDKGHV